ncbi:MAG: multifunctional CCA addition/repair protein [Zoogloeaceae bacterium]|nr:multifunctional CCA addition/repair protein [Zoogloeaceae bacterium]
MEIYVVGGAVRDELLGLPVQDQDYVVVGATPDDMLARGYRPVGRDFPVFLHPVTQAEYALARTERKTGPGYAGFAFHADPTVTLEQDLLRRDLTINAMARGRDGRLIDPYGGQRDLERRTLRHVSLAFAEDPVRILRVARFAARFQDFSVAPETLQLMSLMVESGEADHLVPERVWQEFARGLGEAVPSRMLRVLRACGALARLLPEVERRFAEGDAGEHLLRVIDLSAGTAQPLEVRWACLLADWSLAPGAADSVGKDLAQAGLAASDRLRAPVACRELAALVAREHPRVQAADRLPVEVLVDLLERGDALRRPERFAGLVAACDCHRRALGNDESADGWPARLERAFSAVRSLDAGAVARTCPDRGAIAAAVRAARVAAVRAALD